MLDFQRAIRNEQSILFILAAALGVAVGYGVIGFRYLIGLFQLLFFGFDSEAYFATVVEIHPMWHVVLAPTLGGLVIGLFRALCDARAAQSGGGGYHGRMCGARRAHGRTCRCRACRRCLHRYGGIGWS